MSFSDLPINLQNMYLVNTYFFIKVVLIMTLVSVSFYYLKTFEPKKDSPYLAVRQIYGALYVIALACLTVSPLSVFLLFPSVPVDRVLTVLVAVYGIALPIFGYVLGFNVLQYGAHFLFEVLGIDIDNKGKRMQKGVEEITGKIIK